MQRWRRAVRPRGGTILLLIGVLAIIATLVVHAHTTTTAALTSTTVPRGAGGGAVRTPTARPSASGSQNQAAAVPPTALKAAEQAQPSPTATPRPTAQPAAPTQAKYVVLFVLDGAQPSYYTVPGIPHVRALIRRGADLTNGFAGILESETPSGHAAIASGSDPRRDGILSFAWVNDDNNQGVNLFNPQAITDGEMERILSNAPAPDIAGLVHRHDSKAQVVVLGGHKYYAQDALGGPEANVTIYYSTQKDGSYAPVAVPGHVPPRALLDDKALVAPTNHLATGVEDHLVMRLVQRTFTVMHPRVMLVNIPEFDWPLGHPHGAGRDPAMVRLLMQGFDRDLGALEDQYRRAGILDQTLFVLTSDHGFAAIDHTLDYRTLDAAVQAAGARVVSSTYHTAAYYWLSDPGKAAAAAANIARLRNPLIQAVYFKSPVPGGGYEYIRASGPGLFRVPGVEAANQYLLRSFAGPDGPDIVVLFTENTAPKPGGQSSWLGDHGGATWNSQHLRIVMAGPGIRPGVTSTHGAPLIDIAPTLLTVMGIAPAGMQGVPLTGVMTAPSNADRAARAAQVKEVDPVVTALRGESEAELHAGR